MKEKDESAADSASPAKFEQVDIPGIISVE